MQDERDTTAGAASGPGLTEHARSTLSNTASQAGDKVASRLDSERNRAAEGLGGVAQALRRTSEELRSQEQSLGIDSYVASAADQVERFSGYLRTTNTRQMVQRIEQFAREQPAVFLGSALMLGLIGARFLRSSARSSPEQYGSMPHNEGFVPQSTESTYGQTTPYAGAYAGSTAGSAAYGASASSTKNNPAAAPYAGAGAGATGNRGPEER